MLVYMVGDILPPSNYLYLYLNKNVTPGQRKNKEITFLGILSRYIMGYCTNLFINPYSIRKILKMTQTLYLDFTFMSRRGAYYLFYKNYPQ